MKEKVQKTQGRVRGRIPEYGFKAGTTNQFRYGIAGGMARHCLWKEGTLYALMKQACEDMENGESDVGAIYKFGVTSDSASIKKVYKCNDSGNAEGKQRTGRFYGFPDK